jgi:hypothetical protein
MTETLKLLQFRATYNLPVNAGRLPVDRSRWMGKPLSRIVGRKDQCDSVDGTFCEKCSGRELQPACSRFRDDPVLPGHMWRDEPTLGRTASGALEPVHPCLRRSNAMVFRQTESTILPRHPGIDGPAAEHTLDTLLAQNTAFTQKRPLISLESRPLSICEPSWVTWRVLFRPSRNMSIFLITGKPCQSAHDYGC